MLNRQVVGAENHLISAITYADFAGAVELKYLHLDNNRINSIAADTFTDAINLVFLSLRQNNILDILPGTFTPLVNLMYVLPLPIPCTCLCRLLIVVLRANPRGSLLSSCSLMLCHGASGKWIEKRNGHSIFISVFVITVLRSV